MNRSLSSQHSITVQELKGQPSCGTGVEFL